MIHFRENLSNIAIVMSQMGLYFMGKGSGIESMSSNVKTLLN